MDSFPPSGPNPRRERPVPAASGVMPVPQSAPAALARAIAHVTVEVAGRRFDATLSERVGGNDGTGVRAEVILRSDDPAEATVPIRHGMVWHDGVAAAGTLGDPPFPATPGELVQLVTAAVRAHLGLPPGDPR